MSNRALTWAFSAKLPTTQKFVLVVLADMADERNSCFPSQRHIAAKVGASERTVRGALHALEDGGWVRRERRDTRGIRATDRYFLPVDNSSPPTPNCG